MSLTVSGKPLSEHLEIVGHAKAIDLLYQSIHEPFTKALIFELHTTVQTEIIPDIFKHDLFRPIGAWKIEVDGTYSVTSNDTDISEVTANNAVKYYAKIYMDIAHIHPFFDGNGRLARLLSNLLLLKAGLPPLVIEKSQRREYIGCLEDYQIKVGQLTNTTGRGPDEK